MRNVPDPSPTTAVSSGPFVRDGFALRHVKAIFGLSLLPCLAMAVFNTGLQANRAIAAGATPLSDGRSVLLNALGVSPDPASTLNCVLFGMLYVGPLVFVCAAGAGVVETINSRLRQRRPSATWPIFGLLLALTLPPTTPLWQAFLATCFGILFGQEIFGGPGMSFLNPVLLGRAFLFFAYPAGMSGDAPWIAASFEKVDAFSGATPLASVMLGQESLSHTAWWSALIGTIPGSIGETSFVACVIGAIVLLGSGVASWRIVAGVVLGTFAAVAFFNQVGVDGNAMYALPFHWHIVTGSWAFATVFLATDASSAPFSDGGRWVYGVGIGLLAIVIRVANPVYAEGMMLAILFMNVFAPLINFVTVELHLRYRRGYRAV